MRKKILILSAILILIILMLCIKTDVNVYISNEFYDQYYGSIDINLEIDGKLIFNDSVYYYPFHDRHVVKKLRRGLHHVKVFSRKAGLKEEKIIFLLGNQYLRTSFYGNNAMNRTLFFNKDGGKLGLMVDSTKNDEAWDFLDVHIRDTLMFDISTGFNPVKYE